MAKYVDQERYRIQLPYTSWPNKNTITIDGDVLHEISTSEPLKYRKAVQKLGNYFRREFQSDFPLYHASDTDNSNVVFMWIGEDYKNDIKSVGYGVCVFDHVVTCQNNTDKSCKEDKHWVLMWAWFHPYERRRGHLSKALSYFQKRFGKFDIQHPVSEEMNNFLDKHSITVP